jgi:hypothetical protein
MGDLTTHYPDRETCKEDYLGVRQVNSKINTLEMIEGDLPLRAQND